MDGSDPSQTHRTYWQIAMLASFFTTSTSVVNKPQVVYWRNHQEIWDDFCIDCLNRGSLGNPVVDVVPQNKMLL
jgi:hypothetical protein